MKNVNNLYAIIPKERSDSMNNKYKISFILPTYNVELYLTECIESILNQSIGEEIIIIANLSS